MIIDSNRPDPIYIQIAEWIETEILNNHLKPHDKVYSQYQLAEMFTINPATAAKGLNVLTEENILYGKRGLGKFVTDEAKSIIMTKRKNGKLKTLLQEAAQEAKWLRVSEEELIEMLQEALNDAGGE